MFKNVSTDLFPNRKILHIIFLIVKKKTYPIFYLRNYLTPLPLRPLQAIGEMRRESGRQHSTNGRVFIELYQQKKKIEQQVFAVHSLKHLQPLDVKERQFNFTVIPYIKKAPAHTGAFLFKALLLF